MEKDKYIYLGDSYIKIAGNENQITQFKNDFSIGKIQMVLSTKPLPKPPVKLSKKNLKKYLK